MNWPNTLAFFGGGALGALAGFLAALVVGALTIGLLIIAFTKPTEGEVAGEAEDEAADEEPTKMKGNRKKSGLGKKITLSAILIGLLVFILHLIPLAPLAFFFMKPEAMESMMEPGKVLFFGAVLFGTLVLLAILFPRWRLGKFIWRLLLIGALGTFVLWIAKPEAMEPVKVLFKERFTTNVPAYVLERDEGAYRVVVGMSGTADLLVPPLEDDDWTEVVLLPRRLVRVDPNEEIEVRHFFSNGEAGEPFTDGPLLDGYKPPPKGHRVTGISFRNPLVEKTVLVTIRPVS